MRDNQLVGYGLIVGINGTGDTLKTANVAAVMVTGTLPPFARHGTRLDVTVSALGDAKSLMGGSLLVTPLIGADGEVYAVAQGSATSNSFSAQGAAATVTKGTPTSARIPNGAIVEREIGFEMAELSEMRLSLRNPDFTTANRVAGAINAYLGGKGIAKAFAPATVAMTIPKDRRGNIVALLTDIERLRVVPDQIAASSSTKPWASSSWARTSASPPSRLPKTT